MKRREFISLIGGAAAPSLLWPLMARAQQPGRTYRLGFFLPVARDAPATIAGASRATGRKKPRR